jgi:hypothetical protein
VDTDVISCELGARGEQMPDKSQRSEVNRASLNAKVCKMD